MKFPKYYYSQFLFALFLLVQFSGQSFAQSKTSPVLVTKVSDGDTFWVTYPSAKEEKIRLIGIDTPETRRTGRTEVEHFGKEASAFVKQLLLNKRVRLEFDVQKYDRYKRTLAYAYLESGQMVNSLLVKEGFARVSTYPPNVQYQEVFQKLEREARSARRGLWR